MSSNESVRRRGADPPKNDSETGSGSVGIGLS